MCSVEGWGCWVWGSEGEGAGGCGVVRGRRLMGLIGRHKNE